MQPLGSPEWCGGLRNVQNKYEDILFLNKYQGKQTNRLTNFHGEYKVMENFIWALCTAEETTVMSLIRAEYIDSPKICVELGRPAAIVNFNILNKLTSSVKQISIKELINNLTFAAAVPSFTRISGLLWYNI